MSSKPANSFAVVQLGATARRKQLQIAVIAFAALCVACTVSVLKLWKVQSDLEVYRHVVAGTNRTEIEAVFGPPRFVSAAGETLRAAAGWNGADTDRVSRRGLRVYDASLWMFVVCEFDENDQLQGVTISQK
jgi:hypothetical protein